MIKWYENKKENLNKEIIPNFKLKEFRCKCGKCHLTCIDDKLLTRLNKLRKHFKKPININSGYRCQEHNRENIKGAKYSYHQRGQAVDLDLPKDEKTKKLFIKLANKFFETVRVYENKGFVHCDFVEKRKW